MTYRQWAMGGCCFALAGVSTLAGLLVLQAVAGGLAEGLSGFVSNRVADLVAHSGRG